jgi:hypothetical protein
MHESKNGFESDSQRIRNSRDIMPQLPGLTVATQVEDYVLLNISALLITALFADGGYGKLQTAWRDLLGQRTRVQIPATNVKVPNRCAPFDSTRMNIL